MSVDRRPMRYAHSEGHTDLCYSEDGKYIITCGMDGDIRIWLGIEDDDAISHCVGDQVYSVFQKGKHVYVSTENNNVQTYTFPEGEKDGIVTRYTAPATHISSVKGSTIIVTGSSDMEIHINYIGSSKSISLLGHKAPILGVALDPKEKYVVSSSCDGTVKIWSIELQSIVFQLSCLPVCNAFDSAVVLGRPSWQPSGRLLAIPSGSSVKIYERATWNVTMEFSDERVTEDISLCAFSQCGHYLATATTKGTICIWQVDFQRCISFTTHTRNKAICALAWNPKENGELAYCDPNGQFGTIENIFTEQNQPQSNISTKDNEFPQSESLIFDDNDDDGENVISLDRIKSSIIPPGLDNLDGDSDSDNTDDAASIAPSAIAPVPSLQIDLQEAFQPSSTPSHLQRRFMLWNNTGIIRCINTETENTIDVEFHDTTLHHSVHIKNYLKHTIGALTDNLISLACESSDDTPSKLLCILLNSWDGSREWSVDLPVGEEAQAITAGSDWVAVATSLRHLRIFTSTGNQRGPPIGLPGPIVSLAGHGRYLLVVCHLGLGLPGDQNLGIALFQISGRVSAKSILYFQPLPLAAKSKLQWLGFTDEGNPCIFDSEGFIRILSKGHWLVISDTKSQIKAKGDNYFLIGLSERFKNIRCILCKGARYPTTMPRPTMAEFPFKIPLCELSTEKADLEEQFWKNQTILPTLERLSNKDLETYDSEKQAVDRLVKESVIKLFALACKSDLEARALELVSLMANEQVVNLAHKYATRLERSNLVEKINQFLQSDELNQEQNENETSAFTSANDNLMSNGYDNTTDSSSQGPSNLNGEQNLLIGAKLKPSNQGPPRPIKPLLLTQTRYNPFLRNSKKKEENVQIGSALDSLTSSVQAASNIKSKTDESQSSSLLLKASKNKIIPKNKESNKSTLSSSNKSDNFINWFSLEKSSLQEEFPDLSLSDLTKEGVKRFKEMKASNDNENLKKRKSPEDENNEENVSKKSALNKLNVFSFQKSLQN